MVTKDLPSEKQETQALSDDKIIELTRLGGELRLIMVRNKTLNGVGRTGDFISFKAVPSPLCIRYRV